MKMLVLQILFYMLSVFLTGTLAAGGSSDTRDRLSDSGNMNENFYHSDIHRLFSDLFADYFKDIRPVHSQEEIVHIRFEIALFNVLELVSATPASIWYIYPKEVGIINRSLIRIESIIL